MLCALWKFKIITLTTCTGRFLNERPNAPELIYTRVRIGKYLRKGNEIFGILFFVLLKLQYIRNGLMKNT